ncbi:sigma-54 interaction domain-containing protein [Neofamilia massiliensis]|uniref:sigma-54 interaction domain-containing protein n=1 Tax=Neofamilia massiliensis TaxID=1673724 RepID=UPI0006BB5733|nr:sigma 54-interacting transcriptional regulator [Neofamilia massiliensis]
MKKLLLFTIREKIKTVYLNPLIKLFSDYLEINSLSIEKKITDEDLKLISTCDILLISHNTLLDMYGSYLNPKCKVIYLEFTYSLESIEKLKLLKQSRFFLCFDHLSTSEYNKKLLYNMGIQNTSLEIFTGKDDESNNDSYDYIIVDNTSTILPLNFNNIFNLGERFFTYSTILNIINSSDIMSDPLFFKVDEYVKNIAVPNSFLNEMYLYYNPFQYQLRNIIDNIDYGVLIIDSEYNIINYNYAAIKIFNLKFNIIDKNINDFMSLDCLIVHLKSNKNIEDVHLDINNLNLMITIKYIKSNYFNHDIIVILIKDITKIIKIENSLTRKIQSHGFLAKYNFSDIDGISKEIVDCKEKGVKMADVNFPVLILGESGTGKELFAQSIHNASSRKNFPFVSINIAALPINLLESELFGYEEGSFTGSKRGGKEGLFQKANHGTLFLDEVGDLPIDTQVKLLRVLEERQIIKIGSEKVIDVDIRIIAATNRNIEELIKNGKFRLDLYYRLNTMVLEIPPLRFRKDDIVFFIKKFVKQANSTITFSNKALEFLENYPWNGNIRELKNCINYLTEMYTGFVDIVDLPSYMIRTYSTYNSYRDDNYDIKREILYLIDSGFRGRRSILKELSKNNIIVTEYSLRKLINELHDENLLFIQLGRNGLNLTPEGKSYIS